MSRRIVLAVTVVVLVCLLAVGITSADRAQPPPPPPTPQAFSTIPEASVPEPTNVGRKEARLERARGAKIEIKKLELDRKIAEEARVNGAMQDSDLDRVLQGSGLSPELKEGIGGLIGTEGSQYGSGGLGGRGSGIGGGGGNFGAKREMGRTVYVSNDDSMSLASAQHVLFALQNQSPLRPQDIRPHELLNYFTFKSARPAAGELFDVFASAEREGDHLHVALAVSGGTPPRLPLDLTLLVDVSGSMDMDQKLQRTKRALLLLADQLRAGDRVDLVVFSQSAKVALHGWIAGAATSRPLEDAITGMVANGSTNLNLGLQEAYRVARAHEGTRGRNRRILLVTDANLNTGEVDPTLVTNIARAYEESGIRLTGVGVGRDFNAAVLDELTEKGKGAYVFLGSDAVVDRLFGPEGFPSLTQTIAHDVRFALKLPPSLGMEQFFGEESSTDPTRVQPVHFFAGSQQLLLQDLVMHGGVLDPDDVLELEIRYRDAQTDEEQIRRYQSTLGRMVETDPFNVRKGRALMAWADFLEADARGSYACGGGVLGEFLERASQLSEDREITFVRQLTEARCEGRRSSG